MPVRSGVRHLLVLLAAAIVGGATLSTGGAGDAAALSKPWLWQCEQISREEAKFRCALRLLYQQIEASGDPAQELPRIDRRARETGESLAGSCHVLMHEVGRRYGRAHRLTLATLQRYVPRSNDPTCSAGFGMGLVMYLGPQIVGTGGKGALRTCLRLPTRYRAYTCVHGLGHALMRGYHGNLRASVSLCRGLGRHAPDCAQGAFHDYWISLRGADGTTRPDRAESPRTVCNGHLWFVKPCWFRVFLEEVVDRPIRTVRDVLSACRDLRPLQRSGCIGGAVASVSSDPFEQTRICARLVADDAVSCLRGAAVQALAGRPERQLALIRACRAIAAEAQQACYEWFGRTLAVVTNGAFRRSGCVRLEHRPARRACITGSRRIGDPLYTFS